MFHNRGFANYYVQNYQKAVEDYNQAIHLKVNLQSEDSTLLINLGNAFYELGKYKEAIKNYDKAIDLNKDDCFAYNQRGSSYSGLGRMQTALEEFGKAIKCDSQYADAYRERGKTLQKRGYIPESIKDYEKAASLYLSQNKILDYDEMKKKFLPNLNNRLIKAGQYSSGKAGGIIKESQLLSLLMSVIPCL